METEKLKINDATVNYLVGTSTGKAALETLSQRLRGRAELDLARLKRGLAKQGRPATDSDYEGFWKALEEAGVGTFKPARGSKPDRFQCAYNIRKVAADILSKASTSKIAIRKEKRSPRKPYRGNIESLHKTQIVGQFVVVPIRPGFNVEMKLPSDMTGAEVKKLQETIAKLAG